MGDVETASGEEGNEGEEGPGIDNNNTRRSNDNNTNNNTNDTINNDNINDNDQTRNNNNTDLSSNINRNDENRPANNAAAAPTQRKLEKAVQVPYVESTLSGPNDKGVQVSESQVTTRTSLDHVQKPDSPSPSFTKSNNSGVLDTSDINDCLCQCDSAFDHSAPIDNTNLLQEGGELDEKVLVGALKVTTKLVSFTVFTVDKFEKVICETEKLNTRSTRSGYFEQNAEEVITLCYQVMNRATYKLSKVDTKCVKQIHALGITNQADAVVCWHSQTKEALSPIILSKDTRATDLYDEMMKKYGDRRYFFNETGLNLSSNVVAYKFQWLLQYNPEVRQAYQAGNLKIGTLDSWIIWNLTYGEKHITDYSNAARTMLMNIQTQQWDPQLLKEFDIDESLLPEIKCNSEAYGPIQNENCSLKGVSISASICIPNSALVGTASLKPGYALAFNDSGCTYVAVNMGHDFVLSDGANGTIIAYKISKGSTVVYAEEAIVSGVTTSTVRTESMFPVHSMFARRIGSQNSIEAREIVRLTNQIDDSLKQYKTGTGRKVQQLTFVGDLNKNDLLMQTQADRSKVKVIRPSHDDTASVGAAMFAAHGENLFSMNEKTLGALTESDVTYEPMDADDDSVDRRDVNERGESPPMANTRSSGRSSSAGRGQRSSSISGAGGGAGGGGGFSGDGFPIKWDEIDWKSGAILLLIALALMIIGHMIGKSFAKEPEPTVVRRCPR